MARLDRAGTLILIASLVLASVPLAVTSSAQGGPSSLQVCSPSPANPVINDSTPFFLNASSGKSFTYTYSYQYPFVMRNGTGYTMWLTVDHQTNSSLTEGIYTASSADGVYWTIGPQPILTNGTKGSWDSGTVYNPWVVWNGTMYLMYFTGTNSTVQSRSIGVAFSKDNVHWQEYSGNPIVIGGPGSYDAYWARFPSVIFENGTYRMWYTGHTLVTSSGFNVTIDYATSNDGVHWTKYSGNPVFEVPYPTVGYWSEYGSVIKVGGDYLMTYDNDQNISYAYSSDGIHWVEGAFPLLTSPASGAWSNSSVIFSDSLLNGSELLLWYTGFAEPNPNTAGEYTGGIGLAYCPLVTLPNTITTTQVSATTVIKTTTVVSVQTTLETTTLEAPSTAVPYYQAGVIGLGVVVVALALLVVRRYRPI